MRFLAHLPQFQRQEQRRLVVPVVPQECTYARAVSLGKRTFLDLFFSPNRPDRSPRQPLSYIPSFTTATKQPTGYVPPSSADTSLTAAEEGSYGSPLVPPAQKPSKRWIKWVFLLLLLAVVGLAVGVTVYLGKRVDEHANGGDETAAAVPATPTVILGAPGHAIPLMS